MSESPIKYISALLDNPTAITGREGDKIASLSRSHPYFVPARYYIAYEAHKRSAFSAETLSRARPYIGNWILFCDFLEKDIIPEPETVSDVIEDIERILIMTEPDAEETPEEEVMEAMALADAEPQIEPAYTPEYFSLQGIEVSEEIPVEIFEITAPEVEEKDAQSLMVVMSFSEWLLHFKNTSEKSKEEKKDQKALKTMWQKEKLAAAMEEENEEIPENVFEMAVNSISREDDLASESLADIYIKQGKHDKAMDMYRKLSLRNPKKSAYFARKIEEILKDKQS